MSAPDTGLVGSIIAQADRDKLKDDHPLRAVAATMHRALCDYYTNPTALAHAKLLAVYGDTKLAWTKYLEERFDPEIPMKRPCQYKKRGPGWGEDVHLYVTGLSRSEP